MTPKSSETATDKLKKEIICITGTRADYGIYKPLLWELEKDAGFDLKLVVTGMHVSPEYGNTITDIRKDPFSIIATPSILVQGDSTHSMSQSIGIAILYFADLFQFRQPDYVLLLGDRGEMLAAAIAAHYLNRGIIHIHGGERSGSADDAVRHAISKFAHFHFVSSLQSKANLINMGEEDRRIQAVGSLRKSEIRKLQRIPETIQNQWIDKYQLHSPQWKILVVMHPDSKEQVGFEEQIEAVLSALRPLQHTSIIIIGSNSDAGGRIFRQKQLAFRHEHVSYFSSIPSDEYLFLLSKVDLLVGNTSSGIIEAPFFQLPFLHIGSRQHHREHGDNVVHVDYNAQQIQIKIDQLLQVDRQRYHRNPYDLFESPEKTIISKIQSFVHDPYLLNK